MNNRWSIYNNGSIKMKYGIWLTLIVYDCNFTLALPLYFVVYIKFASLKTHILNLS